MTLHFLLTVVVYAPAKAGDVVTTMDDTTMKAATITAILDMTTILSGI